MTWEWVILVLGLAFIYAVLFLAALSVVAKVSVTWTRAMVRPYERGELLSSPSTETTTEMKRPGDWPGGQVSSS